MRLAPSAPTRVASGSPKPSSRCGTANRLRSTIALTPALIVTALLAVDAQGHPPDRAHQTVRPRVEVIPPIGHRVPDHRRTYNRPSDWVGRWAYHFAPSSQEAMSWHAAKHRGDYDQDCPRRVVPRYEYLKPWQAIATGPRPAPRDSIDERERSRIPSPNDQDNPLDRDSSTIEMLPPAPDSADDHPYRTDLNSDSEAEPAPKSSPADRELDERKLEPPKPRIEPMSERDFEF